MFHLSYFYDNYVSLCAKIKKSPSYVAEAVGLSRTSPNGWKIGKQPTDVNLQKIADYFGVSVDFLLGNQDKEKTTTANSGGFSEKDVRLVAWFNSLPEEKQKAILSLGGAPEDLAE